MRASGCPYGKKVFKISTYIEGNLAGIKSPPIILRLHSFGYLKLKEKGNRERDKQQRGGNKRTSRLILGPYEERDREKCDRRKNPQPLRYRTFRRSKGRKNLNGGSPRVSPGRKSSQRVRKGKKKADEKNPFTLIRPLKFFHGRRRGPGKERGLVSLPCVENRGD